MPFFAPPNPALQGRVGVYLEIYLQKFFLYLTEKKNNFKDAYFIPIPYKAALVGNAGAYFRASHLLLAPSFGAPSSVGASHLLRRARGKKAGHVILRK